MKSLIELFREATKQEKNLDPNVKVVVKGVKGTNSKPFTKKFKNKAAYSKWADSTAADDFEVYTVSGE